MRIRPLSSRAYMNVSESRIEALRWSGSDDERWYVDRLFDNSATYRHWEFFHSDLMKKVAASPSQRGQIIDLRKTRFALLRRQALFQHLRDTAVMGRDREIVVSAFHASTEFSRALVAEHGNFLRSNSSLLCASYLGSALLDDARFDAELERYQTGYMDYFAMYCDWIIASARGQQYPLRPLITYMKDDLAQMQARLMTMPIAEDRRRSPRSAWH